MTKFIAETSTCLMLLHSASNSYSFSCSLVHFTLRYATHSNLPTQSGNRKNRYKLSDGSSFYLSWPPLALLSRCTYLHSDAKYSQLSIYALHNLAMCHIRHTLALLKFPVSKHLYATQSYSINLLNVNLMSMPLAQPKCWNELICTASTKLHHTNFLCLIVCSCASIKCMSVCRCARLCKGCLVFVIVVECECRTTNRFSNTACIGCNYIKDNAKPRPKSSNNCSR